MIKGHGGNVHELAGQLNCSPSDIIDMSSNVNPLGPPPGLMDHLKERLDAVTALPEADAGAVSRAFSLRHDINPENVLAGNGTTQFIYSIPRVLGTKKALIFGPTYSDYADACAVNGALTDFVMAGDWNDFHHDLQQAEKKISYADTVFICNPDNPTGVLIDGAKIKRLCLKFPDVFFIVDESYLPFVPEAGLHTLAGEGLKNLTVLNSMSKIFRIPGLRIGFAIAHKAVIEKFFRYYLPWSVNSLAQAATAFLMEQKEMTDRFVAQSQIYLERQRSLFENAFQDNSDIRVFNSTTSFLLMKLLKDTSSARVCESMARERILIRNCENFTGLSDRFIRISLKTDEINLLAAEKLKKAAGTEGGA